MQTAQKKLCALFVVLLFLVACSTVAVTGRSQLSLVPESQLIAMSQQQYGDFLRENALSKDRNASQMVERVGTRVAGAVERYMRQQGMALEGYAWEFKLVASDQMNAWAMPGGKVVVYEGILPITRDEEGLAVVISHEIAHAVAKHGSERMSHLLLAQLGGMALSQALSDKPQQTQALWMTAFGLGAQVGVLMPYSRVQENEADHLGLVFMAMAGYNPNAAVDFWQRMTAKKQGGAMPEFLSTHPSDATRINNIRSLMPEAMQYYRR
ncbi:MAG: M48 family metallopeptidase [Desulfatibacillaceae bacterium]|nr:M48 family metallopeptidase [Desulfatibacillaceae bacterium]